MRVAVLEDQLLTRRGIVGMLEAEGFTVVLAESDPDEFLVGMKRVEPDVALLDVRLPPTFTTEGLQVAHRIRRLHPHTAVLVLSQHVELEFVEDLLRDESGSTGYLLKDRLLDDAVLLDAIERVVRGELVVDPSLVRQLLVTGDVERPFPVLTDRELEVLAAMAEGLSNAGISTRLGIAERTVEAHCQRVFGKLGLEEDSAANRRVLAVLRFVATI